MTNFLLRRIRILAAAVALTVCTMGTVPALAQPRKIVLIGTLGTAFGSAPQVVGLRDGLTARGYKENEDFAIGVRFVSGDLSALDAAAQDLLRFEVDIIFAMGINAANAARRATSTKPIIFVGVDEPVQAGLVSSFARPGGNLTGVADNNALLAPKRLEILRQLVPGIRTVLFVYDASAQDQAKQARAYAKAARRLGIEFMGRAVSTEAEARAAFAAAVRDGVDGILSPGEPALNIPGVVLQFAKQKGLPTMFPAAFWPDFGALASYAPGFRESGRQAARLVEKIMRGENPADIPVEVNNEIEFVINLKVAKSLGLEISREVLYQAHRIIR